MDALLFTSLIYQCLLAHKWVYLYKVKRREDVKIEEAQGFQNFGEAKRFAPPLPPSKRMYKRVIVCQPMSTKNKNPHKINILCGFLNFDVSVFLQS